MLLTEFFLLGTTWRALIVTLVLGGTGLAGHAAVFNGRLQRALDGKAPVGPFFSSVTGLFALFVAFAAADAWSRDDRAQDALGREVRALLSIRASTELLGEASGAAHAALTDYLGASLEQEWKQSRNLRPSASAAAALHRLENASLAGVARKTDQQGDAASVWAELLRWTQELRVARDTRLRFGRDFGQGWKWGGLLLLAFLSQVSIAFVHLDRRKSAAASLLVFTCAAATALTILAGFEGPYEGIGAVSPEPLLELQRPMAAR